MNADQTPFKTDNNSMFCPKFKPMAANTGIQDKRSDNYFAPEMSAEFSSTA